MNEYEPTPQSQEYVDVLTALEQSNFFLHVVALENHMQQGGDKEEEVNLLARVRDSFGEEYENHTAVITGSAYIQIDSTLTTDTPEDIVNKELFFAGVDIRTVGDSRRVVLDCGTEEWTYLVLPMSLSKLKIQSPETDENIQLSLYASIISVRALVSSLDFRSQTYADQQKELRALCRAICEDLKARYDEYPLEVDCHEYYKLLDDARQIDFEKMYVPASYLPTETTHTVNGALVDVALLDQLDFSNVAAFDPAHAAPNTQPGAYLPLSQGVPCLIMRDQADSALYFIQLNQIQAIAADETDD